MTKTVDQSAHLAADIARRLLDPWLEPLADDPSTRQLFRDVDLISCIETRCGEIVDLNRFAVGERKHWLGRALNQNEHFDERPRRCLWILNGSQRIGTAAFLVERIRGAYVLELSSLYVRPDQRRNGWGRRTMETFQDAARAAGVHRIRLTTEWCTGPAVLFYCSLGMWVDSCHPRLVFSQGRDRPQWRVEITDDVARFMVGGKERELLRAERHGDHLSWHELPELGRRCHRALRSRAAMTFAIALGLRGWPLTRAAGTYTHDGLSAAALGIQLGEAWFRANDWPVRTPKIPGLEPVILLMF